MINNHLATTRYKVILASSSETRRKYIKKHIKGVKMISHLVNENEIKKKEKNPNRLALMLAREKALSVKHAYPKDMIIGSDQILVCDKVVLSKPTNLKNAVKNLLFLRNKNHFLISSIYVLKNSKFYFSQVKKAEIFFKDVDREDIVNYVKHNKETVFSTVGSYKIEENNKYRFLNIIKGESDVIVGFPIKDFVRKFYKDG